MIQALSKYLGIFTLAMLLAGPLTAFAQSTETSDSARSAGTGFCTRLSENAGRLINQLAERETKLLQKQTERQDAIALRKSKRDAQKDERQAKLSSQITQRYDNLMAKADTDAERQAVENFKNTVDTAWNTMKTATDAAITSWHSTVQETIDNRDNTLKAAVSTYKTSVQSAIDKAIDDCGTEIDPTTVKSTLMSSLKTARDQFKSDRQAVDNLRGSLNSARNSRQTSVKTAIETFKTTTTNALADLKNSFGEN